MIYEDQDHRFRCAGKGGVLGTRLGRNARARSRSFEDGVYAYFPRYRVRELERQHQPGNEVAVSVMAQYTPAYKGLETPPFDRPVTKDEYESVVEAASDFGFENGWIQGYEASDPKLALLGENMPRGHGSVQ